MNVGVLSMLFDCSMKISSLLHPHHKNCFMFFLGLKIGNIIVDIWIPWVNICILVIFLPTLQCSLSLSLYISINNETTNCVKSCKYVCVYVCSYKYWSPFLLKLLTPTWSFRVSISFINIFTLTYLHVKTSSIRREDVYS